MNEKLKKDSYEMFLIVVLVAVVLLCNIMAKWSFSFIGIDVLWSMLVYPLVFVLVGLITRQFSKARAVSSVFVAVIVQIVIFYIFKSIKLDIFVGENIMYFSIASFLVSQCLNIAMIKSNENDESTIIRYGSICVVDNIIFIGILTIITSSFSLSLLTILMSILVKFTLGLLYEYLFVKLDKTVTK